MIMKFLANGLTKVVGSKLLPAGLLGTVLTIGHQWWQERDARIALEATKSTKQICEAEHKLVSMTAVLKAEREQAKAMQAKALEAVEFERQVADELRAERKAIQGEFDAYKLSASSDPRCLSDGVLKLLGGAEQGGSAGKPVRPKVGGDR